MPLVRIELIKGRSETDLVAIGNAIHRALVECLNVPERDHFQVITAHSAGRLLYDSSYLGIERTDGIVFVQVFLSAGRTTEQKRAFYARVASLLASEAGVAPGDATIVLVETLARIGPSGEGSHSTWNYRWSSGNEKSTNLKESKTNPRSKYRLTTGLKIREV